MGKYDPIGVYLGAEGKERISLSFREIERLLGFPLPPSAQRYQAWWANTGGSHVQARAWLDRGYETEGVDLLAERLVFVRRKGGATASESSSPTGFAERSPAPLGPPAAKLARHPLAGALIGIVTVQPGVDLTEPADSTWGDRIYGEGRNIGQLVGGLDE